MKTVKELNQIISAEGLKVVLTDNLAPNDILSQLLKLNSTNADIMSAIVELSSDSKNIGQKTATGTPYKGNSIDSSGICHNINANEMLVKGILYVPLSEYLSQLKVLAVAPSTETETKRNENAYLMRQKIARENVDRVQKIVNENPDAYGLLISYVYTSMVAMGKSVTKLFLNTTPFYDGEDLKIEINKKYKLLKSEVSTKTLSINGDFQAKHKAKWGIETTSPYAFLQISQVDAI